MNMKEGNFGKRESPPGPRPEGGAEEEKSRTDPKEHMQFLRGIGDKELNKLLTNWEALRAFMTADSAHGDTKELENLFGQVNARLAALGKRPVLIKDLP